MENEAKVIGISPNGKAIMAADLGHPCTGKDCRGTCGAYASKPAAVVDFGMIPGPASIKPITMRDVIGHETLNAARLNTLREIRTEIAQDLELAEAEQSEELMAHSDAFVAVEALIYYLQR